jgi:hypothetical protein
MTPPTRREVIARTEEAGDHDARMSTGGDGSARRATRERTMSNPSGNTLDV